MEKIVEETIYKAMLEEHPTLVQAVAELVAEGESPDKIEREMQNAFGDVQMVRNVWYVAHYLLAGKQEA